MVNKYYGKYKGAITVEASYISVIVIYVLLFLIYIGFYCHDRAVVNADISYLARIAAKSTVRWLDLDNKVVDRALEFDHILDDAWDNSYRHQAANIEEKGKILIQGHMLRCKVDHLIIQVDYSLLKNQVRCTVRATGHLKFPIYLFGKEKLAFTESCTMIQTDTIKNIWIKDTLLNGVNLDG